MGQGAHVNQERFRSHRLRKGRVSEAGRIYLITTVTRRRRKIFEDWRAARSVVRSLRYLERHSMAETLAYVIMPDHLHWLMRLQSDQSLSRVMHSLKSYSAKAVKETSGITLPVWQRGYHDHAVRRMEDLQDLARYTVTDPLRTGLARRLGDYPHWDAIWF